MSDLISKLGLNGEDTELQWVWEGVVLLILLAPVIFCVPNRRTGFRIARVASVVWVIVLSLVYLFSWMRAGFNAPSRSWYAHLLSCVLPIWCLAGLVILWGSYWLRRWIDFRRGVVDPGQGRGFPVIPSRPADKDKAQDTEKRE